jgi:RNA polymerase sigma factor (sigma-70 family)
MAAVASRFEVLEEKDGDYADICLREDVENKEEVEVFEQKLLVYLTEISVRQQEIVRLRFYENLSHQQIAEILQMSQQSAKNLLHRAIESLRKKITA